MDLTTNSQVPKDQVVECMLWVWEVLGSILHPRHTEGVKTVPVATLLGVQHYKACTGFSQKYGTTNVTY